MVHAGPSEILMIGPEASGKTLLLKQLQHYYDKNAFLSIAELPNHMPTIGVNLIDLKRRTRPSSSSSVRSIASSAGIKTACIRELGGAMGPTWPDYYANPTTSPTDGIIFVVDAANPFGVSESTILLMEALSATQCPFLVCFSKCDIINNSRRETNENEPCGVTLTHFKSLMLYDDYILVRFGDRITTVDPCSAVDGNGVPTILSWITHIKLNNR